MKKFLIIFLSIVLVLGIVLAGFTNGFTNWDKFKKNKNENVISNVNNFNSQSSNSTIENSDYTLELIVKGAESSHINDSNGRSIGLGFEVSSGEFYELFPVYKDKNGNFVEINNFNYTFSLMPVDYTELYICDYRLTSVFEHIEDFSSFTEEDLSLLPKIQTLISDNKYSVCLSLPETRERFDEEAFSLRTFKHPLNPDGYGCNYIWQYNGIKVIVNDTINKVTGSFIIYDGVI